ncbi:MAG: glycosyltransferase [Anaerolineales bacterium]
MRISRNKAPKVAIVHDRLNVRGGGEQVVEELARLYPKAPIFTLIYDPAKFKGSEISKHAIRTSFIDRLPKAIDHHRYYIPLMPLAIEGFDLDRFDLVLSSSAAFAHGVRTDPHQLHISYIHSPMRYAWHQYKQHVGELGFGSLFVRGLLAFLRRWDRAASGRADHLLTNSAWTAQAVRAAFGREAAVIFPPVHTERFQPAAKRGDYYLTVSRLVPYKRVDLIVKAFAANGKPLVVIGEGPQERKVKALAADNIRFLGYQPPKAFAKWMGEARAFVYAAEEDFGITAVEAQAAGCPVLAFGRGGLAETVIDGKTGLLYKEQTVESLIASIERFERGELRFDPQAISRNAERFSAEKFNTSFTSFVEEKWTAFSNLG